MNRHIQYILALMCAKNRVDIFSSFLHIRQNVEWPRFFLAHPVSVVFQFHSTSKAGSHGQGHPLPEAFKKCLCTRDKVSVSEKFFVYWQQDLM